MRTNKITTHHGDVPWLIAHVCNAPAIHRTLCNFCICVNFHSHLSLFSKDSPWDKLPLHCATKALQRCAEGNLVKIIKIKMTGKIIYNIIIISFYVWSEQQNWLAMLITGLFPVCFVPQNLWLFHSFDHRYWIVDPVVSFSAVILWTLFNHSYKNIFAGSHVFSIVLKICPLNTHKQWFLTPTLLLNVERIMTQSLLAIAHFSLPVAE